MLHAAGAASGANYAESRQAGSTGGFGCMRAIEKLSTEASVSVKQLASDLGYASVPAFSHAFRQVTGKTPTEFAGKE